MHDTEIKIKKVEFEFCKRCGRKLKSDASKKIGYGPNCYRKQLELEGMKLFAFVETR